jgi:hypothetical protein
MIRYAKSNWENHFRDEFGKGSTIRTHRLKEGKHAAMSGSRYKPEKVGWVWKHGDIEKKVYELTPFDAVRDGFRADSPKAVVAELLLELGRLNKDLKADSTVFINLTPIVVRFEERMCKKCGCTQQRACEGGCTWVQDDLCSRCA